MSQSTLHDGNSGAWLQAVKGWLQALDQILRGETTHPSVLRERSLQIPTAGLSLLILGLALLYGFCMGMFPGCRESDPSALRWLSCTLKIPALFFLTLCVTFPSLYVVNALVGSRLKLPAVMQLLVAALAVNLAVLASAGPIVAFFSFSTSNGPFMILLNVLVFAVSGLLGMVFLLQTLHRMSTISHALLSKPGDAPESKRTGPRVVTTSETAAHLAEKREAMPVGPGEAGSPPAMGQRPGMTPAAAVIVEPEEDPCALDPLEGRVLGRNVKKVFCCWTVIFAVVGAQMAWVLRPYFGNPREPFVWFGPRTSNFFEGVWTALHQLLS
jgi:hypothetical protein